MHTVLNWLNAVWQFVVGFFPYLAKLLEHLVLKLFGELADGIVALVSAIPVPDFVQNAGGLVSAVPASVWWFADVVQFKFGLAVVLSAYLLRFCLRALPGFF
ncbi:hypothetical protein [Salinisphaera hydrothermalis]|uniref:hypothetical protein n=1 Tax=Salinisphaera hydrothermalis TaxID=563188 RepID=UPI003340FE0F